MSSERHRPGSADPLAALSELDIRAAIRPTVAKVDLAALRSNAATLRSLIGERVALWSVVKADAYGHGAVNVARALERHCDGFAVSLVEEGLELRAAGIQAPIIVLGAYYAGQQAEVLAKGLTPVVYDRADLEAFATVANRLGIRASLHLKIETGMNRLGVPTSLVPNALQQIAATPSLHLAGLCTHFASADVEDVRATEQALDAFRVCTRDAVSAGFVGLTNHAANSAATMRFPEAHFDAVRPGLALYGAAPSHIVALAALRPVLRLETRIMATREVEQGGSVSYGGLWRAQRRSRIATLPIGYADGYPRHVADAHVLIAGKRAPIVGAVCMDMMMVDVTEVPAASVGLQVTLIGSDADEVITVDDVARWAGTVNYEVLCGLSKRVPRQVVDDSDDLHLPSKKSI